MKNKNVMIMIICAILIIIIGVCSIFYFKDNNKKENIKPNVPVVEDKDEYADIKKKLDYESYINKDAGSYTKKVDGQWYTIIVYQNRTDKEISYYKYVSKLYDKDHKELTILSTEQDTVLKPKEKRLYFFKLNIDPSLVATADEYTF